MRKTPFSDNQPQRIDALKTSVAAQKPAPNHFEAPTHTSIAILLVDDMEDNRLLITLFMKGTTYRLDTAENGAVAVDKLQCGTYDLVLMDIQMPVMDGYQATLAIRAWEREQGRVPTPIIALTASALTEDVEKCQAAGFTAHLTKPIKKTTLLEAIPRYAVTPPLEKAI
ncbi:MAG: response regulator [Nitrospira sp.]|jgi:two-component system sensor histidine kinase/response regulator|nr:response regulator [Nitrospira sp.]MBP6264630.1 response regulator [Nitrospira sp.]MBP6605702.1 response regulator [Nitrospira sp.]HPV83926.1 response regulator [Nitrospira sp.]